MINFREFCFIILFAHLVSHNIDIPYIMRSTFFIKIASNHLIIKSPLIQGAFLQMSSIAIWKKGYRGTQL